MGEQTEVVQSTSTETSVKVSFGVKRKEVTQLIKATSHVTEGFYLFVLFIIMILVHVESDEEREIEEQARMAK